jgi:hypothetical protein
MAERDSIVTSYFSTLTSQTFTWKGKEYHPRVVWVNLGIIRGFTQKLFGRGWIMMRVDGEIRVLCEIKRRLPGIQASGVGFTIRDNPLHV